MKTPITQPVEKIFVDLKDARPLVKIGWAGENQARGIVWDISKWQELYGEGTCTLLNQREQDTAPYPCTVDIDGKFAVWQVADTDLGTGGNGKCQLIYQVGEEVVAKSPVYKTLAERSLGGVTIVETPDWVLQVIQAGADAVDAAERAEESAESAAESAQTALESVTNASHIDFEVRQDGHVWLIKTGPAPDDIDFDLIGGRMVVTYGN